MRPIKAFPTFVLASLALLVAFALFAASAGAVEWSLENGKNTLGVEIAGKKTLTELGWTSIDMGQVANVATEEVTFASAVGIIPVKFVAKEVLFLNESEIAAGGKGEAKIAFDKVELKEPAGCTVDPTLETKQLEFELAAVPALASKTALKFHSSTGLVALIDFEEDEGEPCPIDGTFRITSNLGLYAETEPEKTYLAHQPIKLSLAINNASGGNIKLGPALAALSFKDELVLKGALNAGKKFAGQ
jgi:hypothetical protein